jgi:hypothetical protein
MNAQRRPNSRRGALGMSIAAAGLLTLSVPAIASAQADPGPASVQPSVIDTVAPGTTQADELSRLRGLGFVAPSNIGVVGVGTSANGTTASGVSANSSSDTVPSDQLNATLDQVKVNDMSADSQLSLRDYLIANGVDPTKIVAIHVSESGTATITHS